MKPNPFENAVIQALLLSLAKEGLLSSAACQQAQKKLSRGGKRS